MANLRKRRQSRGLALLTRARAALGCSPWQPKPEMTHFLFLLRRERQKPGRRCVCVYSNFNCVHNSVFFYLSDVRQLDPGVASAASLWHHPLWPGKTGRPQGCSQQLYISPERSLLPEADQPVGKTIFYLFLFFIIWTLLCLSLHALQYSNLKNGAISYSV